MKMKELLDSEDKWCKKICARDQFDFPVAIEDDRAVKFCLIGALIRCYPYKQQGEILRKMSDRIQGSVMCWNDNTQRTFTEVKALIDELGI